jgi:Rps23 Pro-64 3,4-dihydroxylase Tpa1-like proline 4-hydroxylase
LAQGQDTEFNNTTAIFYLNNNNGYTIFEDGSKVDSVENRLVVFNSNVMHSGVSQTDSKVRCVINLNYISELTN